MKTTSGQTSKNLFFSGIVILTFTNLINKIIGVMFRIPITNQLGDLGMAYFNAAYHIYTWLYMISTAGLPIAVSILISEARVKGDLRGIKRIYRITMALFVVLGLGGTAVMMLGARGFATLNGVESSYYSILAIAPTLFFVCISSAMRGYFQGYQNMFPTAVSQVLESVGKLVVGMTFSGYALAKGYDLPMVAAYAIAGITIGTLAGMIFLFLCKLFFRDSVAEVTLQEAVPEEAQSMRQILARLAMIAIPITISASIMSLTTMFDDMIINGRLLSIGFSEEMANTIYGNYTALAVPIANMPPVLIYPISYSIIPLLKATLTLGDKKQGTMICERVLKLSAILSIPCSVGLAILAEPVLKLLYNPESAEMAAPLLTVLSMSIFFVAMLSVSNAILQAYGKERLPIISMLIGCGVKLVINYVLIGMPQIGIYGAPISTLICYMTIALCNLYFMSKHTGVMPSVMKQYVRPLLASMLCGSAAMGVYVWIMKPVQRMVAADAISLKKGLIVALAPAILCAVVVYVAALLLLRAVDPEDIRMLPKGDKIYRVFTRLHLMK